MQKMSSSFLCETCGCVLLINSRYRRRAGYGCEKTVRTICALVLSIALVVYYSGYEPRSCTEVNVMAKKKEEGREYLVKTKSKSSLSKIKNSYEESTEINDNSQELLEENKLVSVELSEAEAAELL